MSDADSFVSIAELLLRELTHNGEALLERHAIAVIPECEDAVLDRLFFTVVLDELVDHLSVLALQHIVQDVCCVESILLC